MQTYIPGYNVFPWFINATVRNFKRQKTQKKISFLIGDKREITTRRNGDDVKDTYCLGLNNCLNEGSECMFCMETRSC